MTVDLILATLFAGLTAYAVLGGADFGAGFWDLTAGGAERGARVRGMVKRSMGPVWEANHVWLIFILVIFWTAFPDAFAAVMETLYVPLFIAGVGIILRGTAFAVRGEAATIAEARAMGGVFALSSVLVPFCFGAVIGAIASGQVTIEPGAGDAASWTGPTSILVGVLAVATGAFLAAVFLAGDSARSELPDLVAAFRARALAAGAVAGVLAIAGLFVVREDAPALYDGLTSGAGLAAVIASALAGLATLALVWVGRFELARFAAAAAVGAVVVGWGLAQSPDLLPGVLTIDAAAAPDETLVPLLIGVVIAVAVVVPSLALLFRLALAGRLETEFRPITTGDHPPEAGHDRREERQR